MLRFLDGIEINIKLISDHANTIFYAHRASPVRTVVSPDMILISTRSDMGFTNHKPFSKTVSVLFFQLKFGIKKDGFRKHGD